MLLKKRPKECHWHIALNEISSRNIGPTTHVAVMAQHTSIFWSWRGTCHMLSSLFLAWLILQPWRWRWHIPPKHQLTFNGLHGVITQKLELFRYFKSVCQINTVPTFISNKSKYQFRNTVLSCLQKAVIKVCSPLIIIFFNCLKLSNLTW
jgi:hypothetical protein